MFDSVKIDIKCPYCGETSEIEAQTKELQCMLEVWRKGDFVTDKLNSLDCLADCESKECKEHETKEYGYCSGSGRFFYVRILLENGKVSGEYNIIK